MNAPNKYGYAALFTMACIALKILSWIILRPFNVINIVYYSPNITRVFAISFDIDQQIVI